MRPPFLEDNSLTAGLGNFILALPVLVFSLVAHELAHGEAALHQGDDTSYMLGRLTLNPLPHIDPWYSLLMPGLLWFLSHGTFVFGGAKPIPVNPRKYRNYRRGDIIVSLAGVTTNLVLSLVFSVLFVLVFYLSQALPAVGDVLDAAQRMAAWGIYLNLLLCFFNLIPIPPLDGSHVFYYLLPPAAGAWYRSMSRFGILILLVLLFMLPGVFNLFLWPVIWGYNTLANLLVPFALGTGLNIF